MQEYVLKFGQTVVALALIVGAILLPATAQPVAAQSSDMSLTLSGPAYVTPGSNITYVLTVKNLTNQQITDIGVFTSLPTNSTYVSGGSFVADDNGVEYEVASLAAKASQTLTLVVNVGNGVALGTFIDNGDNQIYRYTIGGQPGDSTIFADGLRTTVEAPGTLVASYKNKSGKAFDVKVDGFQFENYSNSRPAGRNFADDLGADDMFNLFGQAVCQSGNTAANCVLSGPAKKWMEAQIKDMGLGHCDGMAATSLHLFDGIPFKGITSAKNIQSGASSANSLNFPDQKLENYIAGMMIVQYLDEYYEAEYSAPPVDIVNKLITDFKKSTPIPYTVGIFKSPGFKDGHAITAYGVETVNANESRILVYDNNFPNQRKYITVNMAANTWRYETAATPGDAPDVYTGTATSGTLTLTANSIRDRAATQLFGCPFCSGAPSSTSVQAAADGLISGTLSIQYSGEGAFLVVNDEGQKTGTDHDTETFVEEIPNARVIHSKGGLGKEAPPRIIVPFTETDDTFYEVIVHSKTVVSVTSGTLTMAGEGFAIGVSHIELDPQEVFDFKVSPDGDHISFTASEDIQAPEIFISHDPIHPGNPSVIFDIEGITLLAGETVSLDLDPELERIHFDHTGPEAENFVVDMQLIWPDGDVEEYAETIHAPAGTNSAFIDFGAWDGLQHPPIYIDDVLQNPSVNHRLKLESSTSTYDPTPQANAPAGVQHVEATFSNVTEIQFADVYFSVADLAAGHVLLNADGGPAGTGAKISVPAAALGDDGILHVNESFTITFDVGLATADASDFTVDANGVPHDWTHEAPALDGEANNASFVFALKTNTSIFLPLLAK